MDDGRWTMDDGRWTMDDGRWTMDDRSPGHACQHHSFRARTTAFLGPWTTWSPKTSKTVRRPTRTSTTYCGVRDQATGGSTRFSIDQIKRGLKAAIEKNALPSPVGPRPVRAKSVFVSCPFDADYKPLLRSACFTILACGRAPRCARLQRQRSGAICRDRQADLALRVLHP